MKKSNQALLFALAALLIIAVLLWYFWDKTDLDENNGQQPPSSVVNNFDDCLAAGYMVNEMYPRQCQTPDGRTFVEDIGNELDKIDLIRVSTPRPNDTVANPLVIEGEARGFWFFEASFPVKLYDEAGNELATGIAEAKADWMTDDFVPFVATIEFNMPNSKKGKLVLQKDNPSGLPENDDSLIIPVKFGEDNQTQQVSLYYYNSSKDKDLTGNIKCSKDGLVEVKRILPKTDNAIDETIKLLIAGNLKNDEKSQGITTEFPLPDFELEKSSLGEDGTLTLFFKDPQNRTSGGSCRVGVLWNQIEETARQFSEVKSVKFMPEELFQP